MVFKKKKYFIGFYLGIGLYYFIVLYGKIKIKIFFMRKSWNVGCIIIWYDIIDEVAFEIVK